jgi:integrase/recombinase XerC
MESFFLTKKGKINDSFVYRLINSYFSISEKLKKSLLRHMFATHLLNNGADLNSVKNCYILVYSTQVYTQ